MRLFLHSSTEAGRYGAFTLWRTSTRPSWSKGKGSSSSSDTERGFADRFATFAGLKLFAGFEAFLFDFRERLLGPTCALASWLWMRDANS